MAVINSFPSLTFLHLRFFWQLSSFISDALAHLSAIERRNHLAGTFAGLFARFFTHRAYLAIIAALVFFGLHLLLYYFGQMAVQLDLMALLTLFFFALAANALYLTFNHIGLVL